MKPEHITTEQAKNEITRILNEFKTPVSEQRKLQLKALYNDLIPLLPFQDQIPYLRLKFKEQPWHLAKLLKWQQKSYAESGNLHRELYKEYTNALKGTNNTRKLAIAVPRNHAKSSTATIWMAIQIAENNFKFGVIVSNTYGVATFMLGELKLILENPNFIAIYGDLRGEHWSENEIITKNNIKIIAISQGQQVRGLIYDGQRPDLLFLDDIENDELVANKDRIDALEGWLHGAMVPALDRYASIILIGTIISYNALLARILNPKSYDTWKKIKYSAIKQDGTPLWPQYWPLELLLEKKKELESTGHIDKWFCEYMNDPVPEGDATFTYKMFRYYTPFTPYTHKNESQVIELPKQLKYYAAVDLASGKEGRDYNVVLTAGVHHDGRVFVMEYFRKRCPPNEVIEEMFRQFKTYQHKEILVETVGYQATLMYALSEEQKKRRSYLPLAEIRKPKGSKEDRIKSIQPPMKAERIYFNTQMHELEEELIRYPKAPFDDLADSTAMLSRYWESSASSEDLKASHQKYLRDIDMDHPEKSDALDEIDHMFSVMRGETTEDDNMQAIRRAHETYMKGFDNDHLLSP